LGSPSDALVDGDSDGEGDTPCAEFANTSTFPPPPPLGDPPAIRSLPPPAPIAPTLAQALATRGDTSASRATCLPISIGVGAIAALSLPDRVLNQATLGVLCSEISTGLFPWAVELAQAVLKTEEFEEHDSGYGSCDAALDEQLKLLGAAWANGGVACQSVVAIGGPFDGYWAVGCGANYKARQRASRLALVATALALGGMRSFLGEDFNGDGAFAGLVELAHEKLRVLTPSSPQLPPPSLQPQVALSQPPPPPQSGKAPLPLPPQQPPSEPRAATPPPAFIPEKGIDIFELCGDSRKLRGHKAELVH
jgi:hypothetical protein